MGAIITNAGLELIAQLQAEKKILDIDKFIFANIPGLDPSEEPSPDEGMPDPSEIVYECGMTKVGYVSPSCVVYSAVLGPDVGDFDFNWVGIYDTEYKTLMVISYNVLTHKQKTSQFEIGNTISKNIGFQYLNIKDLTGVVVSAETWQIDFFERFKGIDDRERCSNWDLYGNKFFENDAFLLKKSATNYTIEPGIAYIRGIRILNPIQSDIGKVGTLPQLVYIDAWLEGNYQGVEAKWQLVISATTQSDYLDSANQQHYVELCATIQKDGTVLDNRNDDTTGNYRKKEDGLGAPEQDGYVLHSKTDKTRYWGEGGQKGDYVDKTEGTTFWSSLAADVKVNGRVIGSDGKEYKALKTPNKIVNPVGDKTGTWASAETPATQLSDNPDLNQSSTGASTVATKTLADRITKKQDTISVPLADAQLLERNKDGSWKYVDPSTIGSLPVAQRMICYQYAGDPKNIGGAEYRDYTTPVTYTPTPGTTAILVYVISGAGYSSNYGPGFGGSVGIGYISKPLASYNIQVAQCQHNNGEAVNSSSFGSDITSASSYTSDGSYIAGKAIISNKLIGMVAQSIWGSSVDRFIGSSCGFALSGSAADASTDTPFPGCSASNHNAAGTNGGIWIFEYGTATAVNEGIDVKAIPIELPVNGKFYANILGASNSPYQICEIINYDPTDFFVEGVFIECPPDTVEGDFYIKNENKFVKAPDYPNQIQYYSYDKDSNSLIPDDVKKNDVMQAIITKIIEQTDEFNEVQRWDKYVKAVLPFNMPPFAFVSDISAGAVIADLPNKTMEELIEILNNGINQ